MSLDRKGSCDAEDEKVLDDALSSHHACAAGDATFTSRASRQRLLHDGAPVGNDAVTGHHLTGDTQHVIARLKPSHERELGAQSIEWALETFDMRRQV